MKYVTFGVLLLLAAFASCQAVRRLDKPKRVEPACGVRKIRTQPLIVGGRTAAVGAWPWNVAVYYTKNNGHKRDFRCGGTLISPEYILTTASCARYATGKPAGSVRVVLGLHSLTEMSSNAREIFVKEAFIHEEYVHGENMYDVAVLQLNTAVNYTNYIQPACLPGADDKIERFDNMLGTIVGWGNVETGMLADELQSAAVPVISFIDCLKSDRDFFSANIYSGMYCAGLTNGTAPCFGDAGGGMFFADRGVWTLRGIVSFTDRSGTAIGSCNTRQYFGLVNVAHFMPWIQGVIGQFQATAATAREDRSQQF
ncbi:serine protease 27 [Culex quinquefasciatus]|uniref:Serine protease 27 n=1 Tax=Culex quinquefasciatus TaxID=7176 RepID=B0WUH7_CULQU|nr:serine protease 27 [Culex quinquefasciatus]|eukprot:XP_001858640.1 serine protease 27 [Culex quinquefasciatus]